MSNTLPFELDIVDFVGTIDSVPLANWPNPRAPMGPGPKASRPKTMIGPGMPEHFSPRMSSLLMRPNARMPLYPDASFPDQRLCQAKLPTDSL